MIIDRNGPTIVSPLAVRRLEVLGAIFRVMRAVDDRDGLDAGVGKCKDHITWLYLSHVLIEGIRIALHVCLRRPQVTRLNSPIKRLLLIHPPVRHPCFPCLI
ncbi:hypothetical protein D3C72_2120960 [compost metagenome]